MAKPSKADLQGALKLIGRLIDEKKAEGDMMAVQFARAAAYAVTRAIFEEEDDDKVTSSGKHQGNG